MASAAIRRAVAKHFGKDVDYAVVIKNYMPPPTTPEAKRRYSPNKVIGTTVSVVAGSPNQIPFPARCGGR